MTGTVARIGAIARKEFVHIVRDWRILVAVLVIPVSQLLLFAYAISFDVKNVPTVVMDQDKTAASRQYVGAYESSEFFSVKGRVDSLSEVDRAFDTNRARIAVVVPAGFARDVARGNKARVAVLIDGSEPNSAQLGQAYANALNQSYGQRILAEWADRQGLDITQFGRLEPRIRTWYNPEKRSSDYLVPGLMVIIIMIVTVQQTAVTLVRERDNGTQEQMMVSPLRQGELMVGKLLPWTVLAFVDMAGITLVGMLVFGVPMRGSVPFLAAASVVFVFAALGLGLIISALAPSLETANYIALMISFLPAFILSGFAFPLDSIPPVLQGISYFFPGRYMIVIARGVFLKGAGLAELWAQLAMLTLYSVIVVGIAAVLYGRRVQ